MHADDVEGLLKKWANGLKQQDGGLRSVGSADRITMGKTKDGSDAPLGKVCWAHGAGLSRFTPGSRDMLRYLLENGADPNVVYESEGWVPLNMAATGCTVNLFNPRNRLNGLVHVAH